MHLHVSVIVDPLTSPGARWVGQYHPLPLDEFRISAGAITVGPVFGLGPMDYPHRHRFFARNISFRMLCQWFHGLLTRLCNRRALLDKIAQTQTPLQAHTQHDREEAYTHLASSHRSSSFPSQGKRHVSPICPSSRGCHCQGKERAERKLPRGPFPHRTRKRGSDEGEQTPEEEIEDVSTADVHETPPAISTRHQGADAASRIHAPRGGHQFAREVKVEPSETRGSVSLPAGLSSVFAHFPRAWRLTPFPPPATMLLLPMRCAAYARRHRPGARTCLPLMPLRPHGLQGRRPPSLASSSW